MSIAPIDIVIDIIKRHKREAEDESQALNEYYLDGQIDAYDGLIEELEGFRKLFS